MLMNALEQYEHCYQHHHTSLSLSLSAATHSPFHASVQRPTSWPNARDAGMGNLINAALLSLMRRV